MIKTGGNKKHKLNENRKEILKFCRNMGELINFKKIGGNVQYASLA